MGFSCCEKTGYFYRTWRILKKKYNKRHNIDDFQFLCGMNLEDAKILMEKEKITIFVKKPKLMYTKIYSECNGWVRLSVQEKDGVIRVLEEFGG